MRFQVPQFIEVEDKIFGPLTWKQFLYLAGAAGLGLGIFTFLNDHKIIAFILTAPIAALALALAFVKINNRPFIVYLESVFTFFSKQRLYIWKKEQRKPVAGNQAGNSAPQVVLPHLSNSKLKDMAWSLDVTKGTSGSEEPVDK